MTQSITTLTQIIKPTIEDASAEFPPLASNEPLETRKLRQELYRQTLKEINETYQRVLTEAAHETKRKLKKFLETTNGNAAFIQTKFETRQTEQILFEENGIPYVTITKANVPADNNSAIKFILAKIIEKCTRTDRSKLTELQRTSAKANEDSASEADSDELSRKRKRNTRQGRADKRRKVTNEGTSSEESDVLSGEDEVSESGQVGDIDQIQDAEEDDELQNRNEDLQNVQLNYKVGYKTDPWDLQLLKDWYDRVYKNDRSHKIAIFIPDTEKFEIKLLETLVQIICNEVGTIPFVLCFGIGTSVDYFTSNFSSRALANLQWEKFSLLMEDSVFDAFIEEAFFSRSAGLQLSGGFYTYLHEQYTHNDRSMFVLMRNIKYTLMQYFFKTPTSYLFYKPTLYPGLASVLRQKASFQQHIEDIHLKRPSAAKGLLTSNPPLQSALPEFLKALADQAQIYYASIKVISFMQNFMQTAAFKRHLHELHLKMIENRLAGSEHVNLMFRYLRHLPMDQLKHFLTQIQDFLHRNETFGLSEVLQRFSCQVDNILENIPTTTDSDQEQELPSVQEECNTLDDLIKIKQVGKRATKSAQKAGGETFGIKLFNLSTETWKGSTHQREEKCLAYTTLSIKELLAQGLKPYTSLPLWELKYISGSTDVTQAFDPNIGRTIKHGLGYTSSYLSCKCCPISKDKTWVPDYEPIGPTCQATSIVYRLYLDSAKFINLHDWFKAFYSFTKSESPTKTSEKVQYARFLKSVAELQYFGLIKPTKRKTDHMEKLIWL